MHTIDPTTFDGFDWLLAGIVLFSTVAAFFKGIIKVLFSLGGLIVGIILAAWYYPALAVRLHTAITSLPAAQIAAFLLILIAVMVVASLLARILRKAVSAVGLGLFDRLFGAVFGLVRGLLLGVAVMMAVLAFLPHSEEVKDSRLAPCFLAGAHAVSFVVPQHFQQQVATGTANLLQKSPVLFQPRTLTQKKND